MKQITAPLLALSLIATPALSQDEEGGGFNLMEEGAKLFFRGLMDEMEPALKELEGLAQEMEPAFRQFAEEMGPGLRDLMAEIEDWRLYHPPEMLPNGDIILRKKTPEEIADEGGEVEL